MNKEARYKRLIDQLEPALQKVNNPVSRMATVCAYLHHKMQPVFFWTGYYLLIDGDLLVGPYQGPAACMKLARNTGVCWSGINSGKPVIVENVHQFEGHIACNPKSKSEIVVPLLNEKKEVCGVLDVDSDRLSAFDETDALFLKKINEYIYR